MLTDSEQFAFRTHRAHVFGTTGNSCDACQVDEAIAKGHSWIVLGEGVVGLAWAWPVAVTVEAGHLNKIADAGAATLADVVAPLGFDEDDVRTAIWLARALSFAIDPAFDRVCPAV